jgi:hypothetical protein
MGQIIPTDIFFGGHRGYANNSTGFPISVKQLPHTGESIGTMVFYIRFPKQIFFLELFFRKRKAGLAHSDKCHLTAIADIVLQRNGHTGAVLL